MGVEANGDHAKLKIVEIPADVEWQIDEYDGTEWIAEKIGVKITVNTNL